MGEKQIRLKDIAELVGTSTISVHRAIYGKPGISDELRAKILEEVKRQKYEINESASTLRRTEYQVAILLPKPDQEERFFFGPIWNAIRNKLPEYEKQKVKFKLIENENGLLGMDTALKELYDNEDVLHGLITVCENEESSEWLERFIKRGTKVIAISDSLVEQKKWRHIMASKYTMGALGGAFVSHILRNQKGKILLLSGEKRVISNYKLGKGFFGSLKEMNPECEICEVSGFSLKYMEQNPFENLTEYIAVVACNARLTYELCCAVKREGLSGKIPVLGMDVFEELREFFDDGTLTATVYQSAREQGSYALEYLYKDLSDADSVANAEGTFVELPCCLVMKQNYQYYL